MSSHPSQGGSAQHPAYDILHEEVTLPFLKDLSDDSWSRGKNFEKLVRYVEACRKRNLRVTPDLYEKIMKGYYSQKRYLEALEYFIQYVHLTNGFNGDWAYKWRKRLREEIALSDVPNLRVYENLYPLSNRFGEWVLQKPDSVRGGTCIITCHVIQNVGDGGYRVSINSQNDVRLSGCQGKYAQFPENAVFVVVGRVAGKYVYRTRMGNKRKVPMIEALRCFTTEEFEAWDQGGVKQSGDLRADWQKALKEINYVDE